MSGKPSHTSAINIKFVDLINITRHMYLSCPVSTIRKGIIKNCMYKLLNNLNLLHEISQQFSFINYILVSWTICKTLRLCFHIFGVFSICDSTKQLKLFLIFPRVEFIYGNSNNVIKRYASIYKFFTVVYIF